MALGAMEKNGLEVGGWRWEVSLIECFFEMQLVNSLNHLQIYNSIRIHQLSNTIYFWLYINKLPLQLKIEWNILKIFDNQAWIVI
jgi:alanine-alpha-ketoisovalerate/valine-pyruvate aminotransferase